MSMYYIYLIGAKPHGPFKLGVTTNVKSRLCSLQTGFHLELTVIKQWSVAPHAAYRIEMIAHSVLEKHRLRGEWFSCNSDLALSAVETVLRTTKKGKDFSYYAKVKDPIKSAGAQVGGRISADKRKADSALAVAKITDRWPMPSSEWPTKVLLAEADISLNTAKAHLGNRPIAQYNYQAKLKRKEKREVKNGH